MAIRGEGGFTLIEVTLAMTISSALAVLAFTGFGSVRQTLQFTDAVDAFKEFVLERRTEANSTVQLPTGNAATAGTATGSMAIGRVLSFKPGQPVKVMSLAMRTSCPATSNCVSITGNNPLSYDPKWGIEYNGWQDGVGSAANANNGDTCVAFYRDADDGTLRVATGITSACDTVGLSFPYATLQQNSRPTDTISLRLTDPSGRRANVTIDAVSIGVTRRVLQ